MATAETNAAGLTLAQWMKAVDRGVMARASVSVHDLADCTFWDWWHDDMDPDEAAQEALRNDGFPEELL
jgi:hypothetical protein